MVKSSSYLIKEKNPLLASGANTEPNLKQHVGPFLCQNISQTDVKSKCVSAAKSRAVSRHVEFQGDLLSEPPDWQSAWNRLRVTSLLKHSLVPQTLTSGTVVVTWTCKYFVNTTPTVHTGTFLTETALCTFISVTKSVQFSRRETKDILNIDKTFNVLVAEQLYIVRKSPSQALSCGRMLLPDSIWLIDTGAPTLPVHQSGSRVSCQWQQHVLFAVQLLFVQQIRDKKTFYSVWMKCLDTRWTGWVEYLKLHLGT